MFNRDFMSTVWSAAPTPLTADGKLDRDAVFKLSEHHVKLGIKGVFIAGTCGEGAYMSDSMTAELAKLTVRAAAGRMAVAMQITDNSVVSSLFGDFAEDEAKHAAKLLDLLRGFEKEK